MATGKAEQNLKAVLLMIGAAGFEPDGSTAGQCYKIVTAASYPLPGSNVYIPGRLRFQRPADKLNVTVGKRTTFFYRWDRRGFNYEHSAYFKTWQLDAIRAYLAGPAETGNAKGTNGKENTETQNAGR